MNEQASVQNSGSSMTRFLAASVLCLLATLILSWLYSLLLRYLLITPFDIILVLAYGFIMGRLTRMVTSRARMKSPLYAGVMGLAAGVFAMWFAWAAYLCLLADWDASFYFHLLVNPWGIFDWLPVLAANPVWSLGKSDMPALFYYAAWLVEAMVVIGMAVKGPIAFLRENLMCEACGEWIGETGDVARFAIPEDENLFGGIVGGDLSLLPELRRLSPDEGADHWIEVKGYSCPNCTDRDSMVSLSVVVLRWDEESKSTVRTDNVVARYMPVNVLMEEKIFEAGKKDGGEESANNSRTGSLEEAESDEEE